MSNSPNQKFRLISPSLLFVFFIVLEFMYASCISNTRIEKRIIIQVLRVFRHSLLYFGLYTLDLAGSSHKRVSESAQNPTKTIGLRLEGER